MLSQKVRYALRALLHLVEDGGEKPIHVGRIAEAQAVPRKFLEAIMTDLKKAGIVTSRRGPGGGYVLAKSANDISFADVIWSIDGPIALVSCASHNFYAKCGDCRDEETCHIRKIMAKVRDEAVQILGGTSLAQAAAQELGAVAMYPPKTGIAHADDSTRQSIPPASRSKPRRPAFGSSDRPTAPIPRS